MRIAYPHRKPPVKDHREGGIQVTMVLQAYVQQGLSRWDTGACVSIGGPNYCCCGGESGVYCSSESDCPATPTPTPTPPPANCGTSCTGASLTDPSLHHDRLRFRLYVVLGLLGRGSMLLASGRRDQVSSPEQQLPLLGSSNNSRANIASDICSNHYQPMYRSQHLRG